MVTHRLYRSRADHMLAGVCGGLGEYFGVDPTLVRLFFIIAAILTGGLVILVYAVMWLLVPEQPFGLSDSPSAGAAWMSGSPDPGPADPLFTGETPPRPGFAGGLAGSASFMGSPTGDQIHHRRQWFGWALVALGALVLFANLNLLSWLNLHVTWPLFLILAGVLLLLRQQQRR
ncbi:MAG TPA: PspC domain-containing protein [Chloroflexota bacterium]|nr:PspC domain-containing protein [Chloroflexota bacterium]